MFSPLLKRMSSAEPELLSYRKLKRVVQNEKNDHKNPNNSRNYHHDIGIYQGTRKRIT